MAQLSKIVAGLFVSSCVQVALSSGVLAQSLPDLQLDRATITNTINVQRFVNPPSDLEGYPDAGVPRSPTNPDATAEKVAQDLRPAIAPTGDTTARDTTASGLKLPCDPVETPLGNFTTPPPALKDANGNLIAQNAPQATQNDFVQTDLTPVRLPERNATFSGFDAFRTKGIYRLPGRLFFDFNVENSLRFEVNTFQTNRHYLSDMVYRVLPNLTAGYALTKRTRVAINYFFLRDQYTLRNNQLSRNFHSIGGKIDHDIKISEKTMLTAGFMPRVLFINTTRQPGIVYNDLLPSFVLTRRVNNGVIYGSVIGQIRFRDICAKFQEGDQFYSFGGAWRRGKWSYLADTTLVTNFGNRHLRFGPNNQNIIMTFEAGRRVLPGVTAFARAQPIFNMGANKTPGYAGFNFRIFGGLRAEVGKPPIFPLKLKS